MATSKELRERLRSTPPINWRIDTIADLLKALDAEDAERQAHVERPNPEKDAYCQDCGERFPASMPTGPLGGGFRYYVGPFDWRVHPEYDCACHRAYRAGLDNPAPESGP